MFSYALIKRSCPYNIIHINLRLKGSDCNDNEKHFKEYNNTRVNICSRYYIIFILRSFVDSCGENNHKSLIGIKTQ